MHRNGFTDYRFQHGFCNGQEEPVIPGPRLYRAVREPPFPDARISFCPKPEICQKEKAATETGLFRLARYWPGAAFRHRHYNVTGYPELVIFL